MNNQYRYLKNSRNANAKLEQIKTLNEGLFDTFMTGKDAGFANPEGAYKRSGNIFSWAVGKLGNMIGKSQRSSKFKSLIQNFLQGLSNDSNFITKYDNAYRVADENEKMVYKKVLKAVHDTLLDIISTPQQSPQQSPQQEDLRGMGKTNTQVYERTPLGMKNDKYNKYFESIDKSSKYILNELDKNIKISAGTPNIIPQKQNSNIRFEIEKAKELISKIENTTIWQEIGAKKTNSGDNSYTIKEIYTKYGIDTGGYENYANSFTINNSKMIAIDNKARQEINDEKMYKKYEREMKLIFSNIKFEMNAFNKTSEKNNPNDLKKNYEDQIPVFDALENFKNNFGTLFLFVKEEIQEFLNDNVESYNNVFNTFNMETINIKAKRRIEGNNRPKQMTNATYNAIVRYGA